MKIKEFTELVEIVAMKASGTPLTEVSDEDIGKAYRVVRTITPMIETIRDTGNDMKSDKKVTQEAIDHIIVKAWQQLNEEMQSGMQQYDCWKQVPYRIQAVYVLKQFDLEVDALWSC